MKFSVAFVLLLSVSVPAFARKTIAVETGRVLQQNIDSEDRGTAVMPIGTMIAAIPISRQSNIVVVQAGGQRMTWSERITRRGPIVLPVNGEVYFYRDGNWFVVEDAKRKVHKFSLLHVENASPDQIQTHCTTQTIDGIPHTNCR